MAHLVLHQLLKERVPLLGGAPTTAVSACVCLVNENELRCCAQKLVPAPLLLDVIRGDHGNGVSLENRLPPAHPLALEARDRAGKDERGFEEMKLLAQSLLPLLSEVGGTQDGHALDLPPIEQLASDEACLDCFTNAHVIGDEHADWVELESHEQRDELVGSGLDGDAGQRSEWPCGRPKAKANSIAKEAAREVIAEIR
jgi:hypothetical protein